jgi:predicted nucleic-acid-binding Zn-ribbon protein
MGEWGNERLKENFEEHHNKKIRDIAETKAKLFHANLNYFNIYKCPCCGCRTLLTHESWKILAIKRDRLHKAECIYCSYSINVHIDEPNLHGIMDEEIFTYLD